MSQEIGGLLNQLVNIAKVSFETKGAALICVCVWVCVCVCVYVYVCVCCKGHLLACPVGFLLAGLVRSYRDYSVSGQMTTVPVCNTEWKHEVVDLAVYKQSAHIRSSSELTAPWYRENLLSLPVFCTLSKSVRSQISSASNMSRAPLCSCRPAKRTQLIKTHFSQKWTGLNG